MPIEKRPKAPVPRDYKPEPSKPHRVSDGESWSTLGERYGFEPQEIIHANFQTSDAREVNWYLKRYVGCVKMTKDRYNWMFSSHASPGIVHIPAKKIDMDPETVTVKVTRWRTLSFWLELNTGDLYIYKKVRGVLGMRIDHHPTDWYAWNISASLACANIPIKGSPPIGVGSVNSAEATFKYNPALLNPADDWKKKGVWIRLAGGKAWVRIRNALPRTPSATYQPIQGVTTRDLYFSMKVDSPQAGWCTGMGGIEDGRKVKPAKPSRPLPPGFI